jgi:hypothetical protein
MIVTNYQPFFMQETELVTQELEKTAKLVKAAEEALMSKRNLVPFQRQPSGGGGSDGGGGGGEVGGESRGGASGLELGTSRGLGARVGVTGVAAASMATDFSGLAAARGEAPLHGIVLGSGEDGGGGGGGGRGFRRGSRSHGALPPLMSSPIPTRSSESAPPPSFLSVSPQGYLPGLEPDGGSDTGADTGVALSPHQVSAGGGGGDGGGGGGDGGGGGGGGGPQVSLLAPSWRWQGQASDLGRSWTLGGRGLGLGLGEIEEEAVAAVTRIHSVTLNPKS